MNSIRSRLTVRLAVTMAALSALAGACCWRTCGTA